MSYTAQDALHVLGGSDSKECRERFINEVGGVKKLNPEEIKELFPDTDFSQSDELVYFPMRMCHSLPSVNARGRAFTLPTLVNSFASASDQLVNIEHQLIDNNYGSSNDNICGHIKAARIGLPGDSKSLQCKPGSDSEYASVPENAVPMIALGCLFMRHSGVPGIVKEHLNGNVKQCVSMECGHKWNEANLYYRGEFIPFMDAEGSMLECIGVDNVKSYKGHELAVALGGEDGKVNFWGLGMTTSPADKDGNVLAMVSGRTMSEAANKPTLYLPLRVAFSSDNSDDNKTKNMELASLSVDSFFNEISNISPIGKTTQGDSDHEHEVLSDGTIMPANGHTHYIEHFVLQPGSKPRFTARLGSHYDYVRSVDGTERTVVHSHLVDIELKTTRSKSSDDIDPDTASQIGDLEMKVTDLLDRFKEIADRGSSESNNGDLSKFIEDMRSELASEIDEEKLTEAIDAKIQSGDLISKDDFESKLEEKTKEIQDSFDQKEKEKETVSERKKRVSDMGIDLSYRYIDEDENDTVENHILSFGFSEDDDKSFERQCSIWKKLAESAKPSESEAASKEKEKEKKPNNLLLPTAGSSDSAGSNNDSEVATSGGGSIRTQGKKALSGATE